VSDESSLQARRILVTGVVQGVGYRWSMVQQALGLGLTGWVRNRSDGSVEALAQGSNKALAELVAWARIGPRGAQVAHVHIERIVGGEDLREHFVQRPTM
jgi:acylphosphatase